jgi:S-adenosylhomocysteine hydrolase
MAASEVISCSSQPSGRLLLAPPHPDEIEVDELGPRREAVPFVEERFPAGRRLVLFSGGYMTNLTAGRGHTLNSFDVMMTTLAGLVLSAEARRRPQGLHSLPPVAWEHVAQRTSGI